MGCFNVSTHSEAAIQLCLLLVANTKKFRHRVLLVASDQCLNGFLTQGMRLE